MERELNSFEIKMVKKKKKTKMRATSMEAFFYILENLAERRLQVFKAIKEIGKPCSNFMIMGTCLSILSVGFFIAKIVEKE